GGMLSGSTNFAARVGLFGAGASGEIIAGGSDPNSAFYLWLYEHGTDATCSFSFDKGHRWLLLTSNGSVGLGVDGNSTGSLGIGDDSCADFSTTRPPAGAGCDCTPSCSGKTCGDDGCGGSCGTCKSSETCSAGACVAKPTMDSGTPMEDGAVPTTDSGV